MKLCRVVVRTAALAAVLASASSAYAFRADQPLRQLRIAGAATIQAPSNAPSADQMKLAELAHSNGVAVSWHPRFGEPVRIRGRDLGNTAPFSRGRGLALHGASLEANARAVLDNLSGFYRIGDAIREFASRGADRDGLGFNHVRMEQRHGGLRVIGGELIVHFDAKGQAYEVNGRYVPDLSVNTTPLLTTTEAEATAWQDLAAMGLQPESVLGAPELVVFALEKNPRLAFEVVVSAKAADPAQTRWRYWIDAQTGKVLLRINDMKQIAAPTANGANASITGSILAGEGGGSTAVTGWRENNGMYYLYSKLLYWYVYNVAVSGYADNNTYAYRNTANWGTSDRSEMSAAAAFEEVQTYYRVVHGRNSFNNANAYARANVHQGSSYVNAYWDGTDFHFGDGDGVTATSLAVLDVAGHEYTHAVTENTANLYYYGESGALNESFSDVLGAAIEFDAQPDGRALYPNKLAGYADWLLGEDCWIETKSLRDMRNPSNPLTVGAGNEQPSRYQGTYWYSGSGDNGGVHINSGVQNFMFYLLCEGGSGNNDGTNYSVTGIGITNAERVAYRALTVYCGEYTDYAGARSAWISAAQDLNAAWVANVQAAWNAVGVGGGSSSGDAWDPGDNTGAGATELATPTSLEQSHGPHTLSASDIYDWFKVYLNAGVSYTLSTVGGTGDLYGELYSDSNGNNRVAFDDDSGGAGGPFIITYTNASSAWYYLRVRTYNTGQSANYTLQYRVTGGGQPSTDIATALDTTILDWITGGSIAWAGETTDTHDGVDAARSGSILNSQSSWIETTVQGAGYISFWWKVSSEKSYDFLRFYIDGVVQKEISGTVAWQGETFIVPVGTHTLSWIYEKDISVSSGSDAGWVDQVSWTTGVVVRRPVCDFDGDGKSDIGVFRPASATWYIFGSSAGTLTPSVFGAPTDIPVPADFDGNGVAEKAVFRPSTATWYVSGRSPVTFGVPGDIPIPADYDGDGAADFAVLHPSTMIWYIFGSSSGGRTPFTFGGAGDIPIPADYDGDGKADIAVLRPSTMTWYIFGSLTGTRTPFTFGARGDIPLP